tara:strand:+ start:72803 stop:72994 length:192 start_codon:yes stop_codon:yes gene_type:complete
MVTVARAEEGESNYSFSEAARYPQQVSEFDATRLTPEWHEALPVKRMAYARPELPPRSVNISG